MAARITVIGAGTAAANQTYTENGVKGGKTAYQGDSTNTIWVAYHIAFAGWVISEDPEVPGGGNGAHMYTCDDDFTYPPLTAWATGGEGDDDPPELDDGPRGMLMIHAGS